MRNEIWMLKLNCVSLVLQFVRCRRPLIVTNTAIVVGFRWCMQGKLQRHSTASGIQENSVRVHVFNFASNDLESC